MFFPIPIHLPLLSKMVAGSSQVRPGSSDHRLCLGFERRGQVRVSFPLRQVGARSNKGEAQNLGGGEVCVCLYTPWIILVGKNRFLTE